MKLVECVPNISEGRRPEVYNSVAASTDVVITQLDMTLDEMIDQISNENRHDLIDFGPPVGKEVCK